MDTLTPLDQLARPLTVIGQDWQIKAAWLLPSIAPAPPNATSRARLWGEFRAAERRQATGAKLLAPWE